MDTSDDSTAKGIWFAEHLADIKESDCKFTSRSTSDYNCVGYVAGDYQWWQPSGRRGHYWPSDKFPKERINGLGFAATAYVKALESVHFEVSPDQTSSCEDGFEKIAIFHSGDGTFTHVAIVAGPNIWKSKLGPYEDIEHPAIQDRQKMGSYGFVFKYLRRELKYASSVLPDEYKL